MTYSAIYTYSALFSADKNMLHFYVQNNYINLNCTCEGCKQFFNMRNSPWVTKRKKKKDANEKQLPSDTVTRYPSYDVIPPDMEHDRCMT